MRKNILQHNYDTIKPTKVFCFQRIYLKVENKRYLNVFEQQVLDFLLFLVVVNESTVVSFKPAEFFEMRGNKEANGKQYLVLYNALKNLKITEIFWERYSKNVCAQRYTNILFNLEYILNLKKTKILAIKVQVNYSMLKVLEWKFNNIMLNVRFALRLARKYSYQFYIFLLVDFIGDGKMHKFRERQLRTRMDIEESVSSKELKYFLRRAVEEINKKTDLNLEFNTDRNIYYVKNKDVLAEVLQLLNKHNVKSQQWSFDEDVGELKGLTGDPNKLKRLEICYAHLKSNPIFKDGIK